MLLSCIRRLYTESHPSRGGWIEMYTAIGSPVGSAVVPPLTGWVD